MEKIFKFENGLLKLQVKDNKLLVFLQAKHDDEDFKYTSSGVLVDEKTSKELLKWLNENLGEKKIELD